MIIFGKNLSVGAHLKTFVEHHLVESCEIADSIAEVNVEKRVWHIPNQCRFSIRDCFLDTDDQSDKKV